MRDSEWNVLIVEDAVDQMALLKMILKKSKSDQFYCRESTTLTAALEILKNEKIDIIILDLNLPDSAGLDTVLKVQAVAQPIPIIVLSGVKDEAIAVQAVQMGAQDYLVKGEVQRSTLIRAIQYALQRAKLSEDNLKVHEQNEQILSAITSVLIGVDADGRVTHWNQFAEKVFGIKYEETIGRPFIECKIGWDKGKVFAVFSDCLKRAEPTRLEDIPFKRSDGKDGILGMTVNPIRSGKETKPGYLLFGADITKRREEEAANERLEEHLRETQKMDSLGTLAGGISHDFKNILGPILGYTEMMLRTPGREAKDRERLERILKAAYRSKDLIDQILVFSRKGGETKTLICLADIVDEAMKLLKEVIPSTIEIETKLTLKSTTIMANPTQMHQIIMNLCINAGYAMRENGGKLVLSIEPVTVNESFAQFHQGLVSGDYVLLKVRDTGEGITPEILPRIFGPFFTTKPPGEGSGMGLAAVHGIVVKHGGVIEVESVLGKGTTFCVYFPQIKKTPDSQRLEIQEIEKGIERILIVDDNMDLNDMLVDVLSPFGYRVTGTGNSLEAYEMFVSDPDYFHLAIVDLVMPKMNGIKLACEFLQIRPDFPIILCTGQGDESSFKQAEAAGIKKILQKPVSISELVNTIRSILDKK